MRLQHTEERASSGVARDRLAADLQEERRVDLETYAQEREALDHLLHRRSLRLGQDAHDLLLGERTQRDDHRTPAYELRNQAVRHEITWLDLPQERSAIDNLGSRHARVRGQAPRDHGLEADERTGEDKQHSAGVELALPEDLDGLAAEDVEE